MQGLKLGDFLLNIDKMPFGNFVDFLTRAVGGLTQRQKFAHLVQGKAQRPAVADKFQQIQMGFRILALISRRTPRRRNQADLFVITDGLDLDAAVSRQMANAQIRCHFLLEAPVTVGIRLSIVENRYQSKYMSGSCCSTITFDGASAAYKRVLWIVIAINAVMFVVELTAGLASQSMALRADALDFLGDSVTYALSLYVIGKSARLRASAALFKGLSLAVMGSWVLIMTLYRVLYLGQPDEMIMGSVGTLAFVANVTSALLLLRFRNGDANVRSVWLCSRNDAIGNVAVVIAAATVFWTGTGWPDVIVAGIMAGLFLWSAIQIIRQSLGEIRNTAVIVP